ITSLILPAISFLTELDVNNNLLTSLDLSNNQSYKDTTIINCSNNQLTQLNLSVEDNTLELDCSNNQLTELTIMSNSDSRFQSVQCSGNLFAILDFSDSNVIIVYSGNHPLFETINWRNGWHYKVDPDN